MTGTIERLKDRLRRKVEQQERSDQEKVDRYRTLITKGAENDNLSDKELDEMIGLVVDLFDGNLDDVQRDVVELRRHNDYQQKIAEASRLEPEHLTRGKAIEREIKEHEQAIEELKGEGKQLQHSMMRPAGWHAEALKIKGECWRVFDPAPLDRGAERAENLAREKARAAGQALPQMAVAAA